jgi:hypothetical protein
VGSKEVVFTLPPPSGIPVISPVSAPAALPTAKSAPGILPFAVLAGLGILINFKKQE